MSSSRSPRTRGSTSSAIDPECSDFRPWTDNDRYRNKIGRPEMSGNWTFGQTRPVRPQSAPYQPFEAVRPNPKSRHSFLSATKVSYWVVSCQRDPPCEAPRGLEIVCARIEPFAHRLRLHRNRISRKAIPDQQDQAREQPVRPDVQLLDRSVESLWPFQSVSLQTF